MPLQVLVVCATCAHPRTYYPEDHPTHPIKVSECPVCRQVRETRERANFWLLVKALALVVLQAAVIFVHWVVYHEGR